MKISYRTCVLGILSFHSDMSEGHVDTAVYIILLVAIRLEKIGDSDNAVPVRVDWCVIYVVMMTCSRC